MRKWLKTALKCKIPLPIQSARCTYPIGVTFFTRGNPTFNAYRFLLEELTTITKIIAKNALHHKVDFLVVLIKTTISIFFCIFLVTRNKISFLSPK